MGTAPGHDSYIGILPDILSDKSVNGRIAPVMLDDNKR
jgi:hypothetical protein